MAKNDSILVLCAHSDDQIFGPGGTIARYSKEGKEVFTIIFSYGETSHLHLKRKIAVKMRVEEAKEADKIIGGSGIYFLGLNEGSFVKDAETRGINKILKRIISDKKPGKIFTHSSDDPHNDHRAVYRIVTETFDKMRYNCDVYSFDVWNPINLDKRSRPKLYVDITGTFNTKLSALKCFRSQKIAMLSLLWSVYLRAIANGFHIDCRYAERFYKIR